MIFIHKTPIKMSITTQDLKDILFSKLSEQFTDEEANTFAKTFGVDLKSEYFPLYAREWASYLVRYERLENASDTLIEAIYNDIFERWLDNYVEKRLERIDELADLDYNNIRSAYEEELRDLGDHHWPLSEVNDWREDFKINYVLDEYGRTLKE